MPFDIIGRRLAIKDVSGVASSRRGAYVPIVAGPDSSTVILPGLSEAWQIADTEINSAVNMLLVMKRIGL